MILEQYGRYGVVDNGKTGGIHTSVEVQADGTTKTIGTHTKREHATLVAKALHEYTRSKVEDEPDQAEAAAPRVFGFTLFGLTFSVGR